MMFTSIKRISFILFLLTILFACRSKPKNIFDRDEKILEITDAALTRDTSRLEEYLDDPNSEYRARAAFLFHTMYRPGIRQKLEAMLSDTSGEVRKGAAYALGQFGKKESIEPLTQAIESEKMPEVRAVMLEAYGKCGDVRNLKYLTSLELHGEKEIEGWAYGMYRLGVFSAHAVEQCLKYYGSSSDEKTKRALSFYLGDNRTGDYRVLIPYDMEIKALINECEDPVMKSYLVNALRAVPLRKKSELLLQILAKADNELLRFRCIEQLAFTPSGAFIKDIAKYYLRDSSLHIRLNLMNWLADAADSTDLDFFEKALKTETNEQLLVYIYKGWLRLHHGSPEAAKSLIKTALTFENDQARADLFAVLADYSDRYTSPLLRAAYLDPKPVVAYRIVEGIRNFFKKHEAPDSIRQSIAAYSIFMIRSDKDPLMVYGAELLADTAIKAYELIEESTWLEEMLAQALKPRIEYAFMRAVRAVKGLPIPWPEYYIAPPARPDWEEIKKLPARFDIVFHSTRGEIRMQMFTEEAPMSVWRFWDLCRSGYYDSSEVHRVVYPHVIQGGSQFGDGYSDDLSPIRTETGYLHFDSEGYVGFASDGRDTETGQWFITHLPRPHLDPNYTIFAKVTEGMEVVNDIFKGDLILSCEMEIK